MTEQCRFDFHIHSKYSYDSLLAPETIIRKSLSKGLNAIAITDHNTIRGSVLAKTIRQDSLLIVTGAEIATEYGDLTGLFLNEDVRSRVFVEVIDEIRDQGGLVVLPHPCRRKRFPDDNLLSRIDIFEGINARNPDPYNNNAQKLSRKFHKPMISGSDAHTIIEIGNAWTCFPGIENLDEEALRKKVLENGNYLFQAKTWQSRKINQVYSSIIKIIRKIMNPHYRVP